MERKGHHTYLTAWGETKTLAEWTRDPRCVVKEVSTLSSRVRDHGMSDQEAMETPLGANVPQAVTLTYQGETKTLREWINDPRCIPKVRSTLLSRLQKGWSHERILTQPLKPQGTSSRALKLTAWGETKTVPEWVEDPRCRVDSVTLRRRLRRSEYSPEQCMSVPPGRLTTAVTAWGETMTPKQWEADPRCRVNMHTLKRRLNDGWAPEEALRTPSLRDDQMTLAQRFEAEVNAMAALGKADRKERFSLISRDLILEAASGVKGEVQVSNKYLVDKRFCTGIWAEPVTMLALVAELVSLTTTDERFRDAAGLVRRFLGALSDRRSQGSGDLYLFAGWFCADEHGEVWRG